jgi:hypothetical protein
MNGHHPPRWLDKGEPTFFAAVPLKLSIASAGAAEVSRQRFPANLAQTHSRALAGGSLGMLLGCGNVPAAGSEWAC